MSEAENETLKLTSLNALHRELGARMVAFAGHSLPVQYAGGIIAEHNHTRAKASLFDVSHMGQIVLGGSDALEELHRLVPGNIEGLGEGRIRYTMLTNAKGGIIDDLMVSKDTDHLRLVVNGSRVDVDLAHLGDELGGDTTIDYRPERALVALQGPAAVTALSSLNVAIAEMSFMSFIDTKLAGKPVSISRCGYTGEDGFEISAAVGDMDELARIILDHADVEAAGLGARDSLRLEAGLCLYGQDIDDTTSPIEAGLHWTITKKRLETGGFLGANIIQNHAESGTDRCLVGLVPEGRALARPGGAILDNDGVEIGIVTSGGFGATFEGPMALGYVPSTLSKANTKLKLQIRKSQVPATVTTLPFVPHRYFQRTNRS